MVEVYISVECWFVCNYDFFLCFFDGFEVSFFVYMVIYFKYLCGCMNEIEFFFIGVIIN